MTRPSFQHGPARRAPCCPASNRCCRGGRGPARRCRSGRDSSRADRAAFAKKVATEAAPAPVPAHLTHGEIAGRSRPCAPSRFRTPKVLAPYRRSAHATATTTNTREARDESVRFRCGARRPGRWRLCAFVRMPLDLFAAPVAAVRPRLPSRPTMQQRRQALTISGPVMRSTTPGLPTLTSTPRFAASSSAMDKSTMSGRPYNYPSGEAPLRRYVFVSNRVVKTFSVNAYTEAQASERAEVDEAGVVHPVRLRPEIGTQGVIHHPVLHQHRMGRAHLQARDAEAVDHHHRRHLLRLRVLRSVRHRGRGLPIRRALARALRLRHRTARGGVNHVLERQDGGVIDALAAAADYFDNRMSAIASKASGCESALELLPNLNPQAKQ